MPTEEKIKISKNDKSINVMIVDETPQDWRLWKAFTRLLTRQNDLALKIYAVLLEKKENQISSRDIASIIGAPLYSVRPALKNLHELGIISREVHEMGYLTFEYWKVKIPVLGLLRLIPKEYFQDGYPKD